jgi:hypothetical protein
MLIARCGSLAISVIQLIVQYVFHYFLFLFDTVFIQCIISYNWHTTGHVRVSLKIQKFVNTKFWRPGGQNPGDGHALSEVSSAWYFLPLPASGSSRWSLATVMHHSKLCLNGHIISDFSCVYVVPSFSCKKVNVQTLLKWIIGMKNQNNGWLDLVSLI